MTRASRRRGLWLVVLGVMTACGPTPSQRLSPTAAAATAFGAKGPCGEPERHPEAYDHVIWIWMENKNTAAIEESGQAAFLNGLAARCGFASDYVDEGIHPSLPNYIAATSGDTQGITDDGSPDAHPLDVDNLFRQVRAAGGTAKSYEEAMPEPCSTATRGDYAARHNPAAYYVGGSDREACARDSVPFDQFEDDLNSSLPSFSFITPNLCNDTHSCPIGTGDEWLSAVTTQITSSAVYQSGSTAVFIVFDESEGAGTMPFVAVAPSVPTGTRVTAELNHYSLLAFTEDVLGLARLGHAVDASDLAGPFNL